MKGNHFQSHISNHFKARFPYLYISTWEEERALSAVRVVCEDQTLIKTPGTEFTWSSTTGMVGDADFHAYYPCLQFACSAA